jgi:hypothetical protein
MTEAQVLTAKAVYEQLLTARLELARLAAIKPLLSGVTLHAPGMAPIRLEGLQAQRLACMVRMGEDTLAARITALEQQLAAL